MIHEVTEILDGTRYVMKIPLFKEESIEAMNHIAAESDPLRTENVNIHKFLKDQDEKRYYEIRNSDLL